MQLLLLGVTNLLLTDSLILFPALSNQVEMKEKPISQRARKIEIPERNINRRKSELKCLLVPKVRAIFYSAKLIV